MGEWAAGRAVVSVTARLRSDLLTAALERGPSWLAGERAGELALTATSGAEAVGVYVGRYLPQLVLAVLAPVGVLAWVGATDWISLLLLAALVALVPPTMRVFLRRAAEATEREWRGLSSLSAHLLELVQGLPTLRAFGRVDYGRREVAEASERLRRSTLRTLRVAFLSSLSLELLAGLGTGLVAMVLGLRLLGGHTSLYVALAVLLVSPEVFLPLRRASAEFHAAAAGRTAGERIAAVVAGRSGTPSGGAAPPGVGAVGVFFEGATVAYADRASPALDTLTLAIEPGRRVALVGPSGSGKSTALHALVALVPLRAGRILVDGTDLASLDAAAWRARVAWVPQRPYLFSGTLRENLALANPGADPAALDAAMAVAGLGEVARRLPDGLDTVLGERGATLSSGERHRVAIARAVLHGGDLVLLGRGREPPRPRRAGPAGRDPRPVAGRAHGASRRPPPRRRRGRRRGRGPRIGGPRVSGPRLSTRGHRPPARRGEPAPVAAPRRGHRARRRGLRGDDRAPRRLGRAGGPGGHPAGARRDRRAAGGGRGGGLRAGPAALRRAALRARRRVLGPFPLADLALRPPRAAVAGRRSDPGGPVT